MSSCPGDRGALFGAIAVDLPPRFKTATHADDVSKTTLDEVSGSAEATVAVIAKHHDRFFLVAVLHELLYVLITEMKRAWNVRGLIGTGIAHIDKRGSFFIEPLLCFVYWNLRDLHWRSPRTLVSIKPQLCCPQPVIIRSSIWRHQLSCYNRVR